MIITKDTLLLFDFGCILVNLDKQRCINALKKVGCGPIASYVDEHRSEDLFHEIELGRPTEQFCLSARRQSAYLDDYGVNHVCQAADNEICWAWNQLLTGIDAPKLRLIRALRQRGFRTAVLSNTNFIHWRYSLDNFFNVGGHTIDDYFEHVFLSCELGMVKPDRQIYQTVLDTMDVKPEQVYFIDDSLRNCRGAQALGIHTMHDPDGTLWVDRLQPLLYHDSLELDTATPAAAVIGNFDGVHRGHQYVLNQLKEEAAKRGLKTMAITFDRHPRTLLQPGFKPSYITTPKEKVDLLREQGIDDVRIFPFTADLAGTTAKEFMQQTLSDTLGVKLLLLGYDNRFGKFQSGETFAQYQQYALEVGMEVLRADPVDINGDRVSSSLIRHELKAGHIERANELLGRTYTLSGVVVQGKHEGNAIGFPTANLKLDDNKLLPRKGVYVSLVNMDGHHHSHLALTNIGIRPTYNDGEALSIETHIIDAHKIDLYGSRINVQLLSYLREEQKFPSIEDLRTQIVQDVEQARLYANEHLPRQ